MPKEGPLLLITGKKEEGEKVEDDQPKIQDNTKPLDEDLNGRKSPGSDANIQSSQRQSQFQAPKVSMQLPRGKNPMVIAKDHSKSRQERQQRDTVKVQIWAAVLFVSAALFLALLSSRDVVGNLEPARKMLDYGMFFVLLFVVSRFLTTTAAVVIIASVAAFHYFEKIHYKDQPPPVGLSNHHFRYFMIMFLGCFLCLHIIAAAKNQSKKA